MQRFFTITSILLLVDCCVAGDYVASKESPWSGDLADTKCNVASVEWANENQLADILDEIVNTQFFRLIRIDLKNNLCPFWKGEDEHEEEEDVMCENTIESTIFGSFEGEKESACSLSMDDTETPLLSIPRVPTTDDIDRTLTRVEVKHTSTKKIISDDPSMPGFWLDLLSNIWLNSSDYINLQLNPERWTGYDGSDVWSAMYDENCFSRLGGGVQKTDRLCYEERVMYRLLSGMHTATNVHINMKYFPPRRGVRTEWEPNPGRFMEQYGGKGQFIQNMHFAFVVLLRAAQRASPLLYNYNSPMLNDDQVAKTLLKRLLDSQILQSCSPVFEAFDESLLFNDEFHNITTLKRQFKGVFQNISSVLDCVTCEKCKMHAKVSVLGLGWALKTLLLPETMLVSALHEPEIVAFINTLHKFSHAIRHAKELSVMFATSQSGTNVPSHETISSASSNSILNKRAQSSDVAPSLPPSPSLSVPSNDDRETKLAPNVHEIDRIVGLIADSARRSLVDSGAEDRLIDLALASNPGLFALAKHYFDHPATFARHALRNLNSMARLGGEGVLLPVSSSRAVLGSESNPADAIIVGSGLSGLAAALSVLDRGGSVVLVEKMGFFGGNSAKASSGINGIDPMLAKEQNDSSTIFLADMLTGGRCVDSPSAPLSGEASDSENFKTTSKSPSVRAECALASALVSGSGDALSWVRNRVGMPLDKVGQLGGHSFPRTYRPTNGLTGAELVFALSKKVKSFTERDPSPLRILLKMKVTSLSFRDDEETEARRIESVACESSKDGAPVTLFGRNVILATGGFGSDFSQSEEGGLIHSLRPELADFATTNGKWATGDGHKMAMRAGAGTVDLRSIQVHPTGFVDPRKPKAKVKTLCAELLRGVGGVLLNREGERFVDELGTRAYISGQMRKEAKKWSDPSRLHFTIVLNNASAAEADKHVPLYVAKGLLTRHESALSVSNALNITVGTFRDTIRKYNANASRGVGTFGKTSFSHAPFPFDDDVPAGPFYIGTVTPVVHYCMGGVATDENGRVLSDNATILAHGFYAVGEIMGGVHGANRLGGNALTECVVFGLKVGTTIPITRSADAEDGNIGGKDAPRHVHSDAGASKATKWKQVSAKELGSHGSDSDCWVAIHGRVFDFTEFAEDHPGGGESIWNVCGRDGTHNFDTVHTVAMLEDFAAVGVLSPSPVIGS